MLEELSWSHQPAPRGGTSKARDLLWCSNPESYLVENVGQWTDVSLLRYWAGSLKYSWEAQQEWAGASNRIPASRTLRDIMLQLQAWEESSSFQNRWSLIRCDVRNVPSLPLFPLISTLLLNRIAILLLKLFPTSFKKQILQNYKYLWNRYR